MNKEIQMSTVICMTSGWFDLVKTFVKTLGFFMLE